MLIWHKNRKTSKSCFDIKMTIFRKNIIQYNEKAYRLKIIFLKVFRDMSINRNK